MLSKVGCCICDGLKDRLDKLNFDEFFPSISYEIVYLNESDFELDYYSKYKYEIPVLFLIDDNTKFKKELARISPRMKDINLFKFIQKQIDSFLINK